MAETEEGPVALAVHLYRYNHAGLAMGLLSR